MAGRFEGVSDLEWRLFEDVFPPAPPQRRRGMPHAPFRKILNTLSYGPLKFEGVLHIVVRSRYERDLDHPQ